MMPVRVVDRGSARLRKRLRRMHAVRVGIMGSAAVEAKTREGGKNPGVTVIQIAEIHEYGIGVPERSFIRAYHDENVGSIRKWLAEAGRNITKRADPARELGRIGLRVQDGIVTRIEHGIEPQLKEETKRRKGDKDTPLILTGQLRSSITYDVVKGVLS